MTLLGNSLLLSRYPENLDNQSFYVLSSSCTEKNEFESSQVDPKNHYVFLLQELTHRLVIRAKISRISILDPCHKSRQVYSSHAEGSFHGRFDL